MAGTAIITEANSYLARRNFLHLPWLIYKGDTNWVPPLLVQVKASLDTRRNPFYRRSRIKLFTAEKDGRTAGRIAAIVNGPHNEFHGDKAGFFGFFECIDDPAVADALLAAAKNWLASQGMNTLRGPANPSTNHDCGLLVDGFSMPPQVMMPFNPQYYPRLLEACGLRKAKDLYAYKLTPETFSPQLRDLADRLAKRASLEVRPIDMKNFRREADLIREIYNKGWERNWGFVPVDDAEFDHLAKEMKQILEPSLVLIGFAAGRPAGFSVTLPNINEPLKTINGRLFPFGLFKLMAGMKKIKSGRNLLMGVIPECRKMGLDVLMYKCTVDASARLGYTWGELSWILEDNIDMRRVLEKMGASVYKTYRLYECPIHSA